jgi:uncharacterized protein (DUF1330 family)
VIEHAKVSCRVEQFQHSFSVAILGWKELAMLFFERGRRFGPWIDRFLKAAAFGAMLVLLVTPPALARGGGGHGMGGFGLHGGGRMGRGERLVTPAYVLITISSVSDADALKKAIQAMATSVASFSGRLAIDAEKPLAWEGAAPEHVVLIQFIDTEQAQAWKNSDAFKSFDADLHKGSAPTMQLVQGLPMPEERRGRGGRGLDAKAFEPNVKDYDRLLDQRLKTICMGC